LSSASTMKSQAVRHGSRTLPAFDYYDKWLICAVIISCCLGLIMLVSTSGPIAEKRGVSIFYYFWRQIFALGIGGFFALLIVKVESKAISKIGPLIILIVSALLVLVLLPYFSHEVNGSKRWLYFSGWTFQPSELAKLAVVIYLAAFLVRHNKQVRTQSVGLIKVIFVLAILAALLLAEPDFGSSVVLSGTGMGMIFLAGVPLLRFLSAGAGIILMLGIAALVEPYRAARIISFLNPWKDERDTGYQLTNALIALGRGDWLGVGLGNSVQALHFLPEAHTDFVFAVIGEELGTVGAIGIILIFVFIVWRIFRIGVAAEKIGQLFGAYMTYGVSFLIGMQAMVHVGVNLGYLPTKGLPLPFISYASNNLIFILLSIGLVLRVGYETAVHSGFSVAGGKPND
jgi:cell division protein FtsW